MRLSIDELRTLLLVAERARTPFDQQQWEGIYQRIRHRLGRLAVYRLVEVRPVRLPDSQQPAMWQASQKGQEVLEAYLQGMMGVKPPVRSILPRLRWLDCAGLERVPGIGMTTWPAAASSALELLDGALLLPAGPWVLEVEIHLGSDLIWALVDGRHVVLPASDPELVDELCGQLWQRACALVRLYDWRYQLARDYPGPAPSFFRRHS